jgi:hypothetical protein
MQSFGSIRYKEDDIGRVGKVVGVCGPRFRQVLGHSRSDSGV